MEETVRNKLNSVQRMEVTYGRIEKNAVLSSVLSSDADKIRETMESMDEDVFEQALIPF